MRLIVLWTTLVPALLAIVSCQRAAEPVRPDQIIVMEKAALDRWGKGDPRGYLDIMAEEMTYFDPTVEKRIDGLEALTTMMAPFTGKIHVSRFDMIDPKVQPHGDTALLTFNLVSYVNGADGTERAIARWNSSELYGRIDGQWRIVHSHWSYIKPDLKQPITEES